MADVGKQVVRKGTATRRHEDVKIVNQQRARNANVKPSTAGAGNKQAGKTRSQTAATKGGGSSRLPPANAVVTEKYKQVTEKRGNQDGRVHERQCIKRPKLANEPSNNKKEQQGQLDEGRRTKKVTDDRCGEIASEEDDDGEEEEVDVTNQVQHDGSDLELEGWEDGDGGNDEGEDEQSGDDENVLQTSNKVLPGLSANGSEVPYTAAAEGNYGLNKETRKVSPNSGPTNFNKAHILEAEREDIHAKAAKATRSTINEFVKDHLFRKVKFITNDSQLRWDFEFIAGAVMEELDIDDSVKFSWWKNHQGFVTKALNAKRASVNQSIKETVIELMRNDKMPKLEEVLKMGQGETDAYTVFCDNILSQVVGRNVWKRDSPKTDVSELATVSDEAFAILLLENSYDLWSQMARQKEAEKANKEFTEQAKIAKYTLNGAGIKKNKGWRKEGLERFNQIVKDVLKDRETGGREGFEEEYREGKKQMEEEKNGKKKKKKSSEQEKEVEFEVYMDIHQPKKKKKDSEATNAESEYSKVEVHEM